MGTLTGLLDLSRNALLADQTAINATAQNISNENAAGYARRVVTFQVQDSVNIRGTSLGRGVAASVSAQRDPVLDGAVQQQTSLAAESATRLAALDQLQALFSLGPTGEDVSGIGAAIGGLYGSAAALGSNGADTPSRQAFLSAAQTFAGSLNRASAAISEQSAGLDQQVTVFTGQVNQLALQYATINGQITNSGSADTSGLEDQRQAVLDQISRLAGVNQVRTDGKGISLTLGNGALLVGGSEAHTLSATVISGRTHVLTGDGTDLTATIAGGSLGGTIKARDIDLPAASHSLDLLAFAVGDAVNQQSAAGVDAQGNPGAAVFDLHLGQATAGAITVALSDPNAVAAALPGEGGAGGGNARAIAALGGKGLLILSGATSSQAFTSLLSGLGATVASANAANQTNAAGVSALQSRRDALSGVSLDQEGADLTQYQRSYEVEAKVLSIVNQLLASAINLGTPTSVS